MLHALRPHIALAPGLKHLAEQLWRTGENSLLQQTADGLALDVIARIGKEDQAEAEAILHDEISWNNESVTELPVLNQRPQISFGEGALGFVGVGKLSDDPERLLRLQGRDQFGCSRIIALVHDGERDARRAALLGPESERSKTKG